MKQMLAKKADVNRIYLPCQEGERLLKNMKEEYKTTMITLYMYIAIKDDEQI